MFFGFPLTVYRSIQQHLCRSLRFWCLHVHGRLQSVPVPTPGRYYTRPRELAVPFCHLPVTSGQVGVLGVAHSADRSDPLRLPAVFCDVGVAARVRWLPCHLVSQLIHRCHFWPTASSVVKTPVGMLKESHRMGSCGRAHAASASKSVSQPQVQLLNRSRAFRRALERRSRAMGVGAGRRNRGQSGVLA